VCTVGVFGNVFGCPWSSIPTKQPRSRSPKHAADKDAQQVRATQITRALAELRIGRIAAHTPQAKAASRFFATAHDRLVQGLRLADAGTLDAANK
jgi:hypothetical protein